MKPLVVILMGSPADLDHCQSIKKASESLGLDVEMRTGSAHRTPEHVLQLLRSYEQDPRPKVYITVAGRSNALSGFTDPQVSAPVIACPPPGPESDIWSSVHLPPGVACAYIAEPSNAAMFAAKILAHHDKDIASNIARQQATQRERVIVADSELRNA